ncbi:FAD-binding protein, partial [Clostridium perfringens]
MNQYKVFKELFEEFYKSENVIIDAEMKNYVHFRVGGPADILLIPESKDQVIKTIENCREKNIPFYVVGNGSNLLVKDGGLKGVVIKLNEVKNIKIVGD